MTITNPVHHPDTSIGIDNFREDVIRWFSGLQSGHLGKWRYDYLAQNDPASGGHIWEKLATEQENYYVSREGDRLLMQAMLFMRTELQRPDWIIDLGPGKLRPHKTDLITFIGRDAVYVPVDMSFNFLEEARALKEQNRIKDLLPYHADFTKSQIMKTETGKKLFMFLGATLGNLPAMPNHSGKRQAVELLQKISESMNTSDQLLLVTDGNQNAEQIKHCYDADLNYDFYMVLLHKIQLDLKPVGQFDPLAWKPDIQWCPETSQCSHALVATKDQVFSIGNRAFYIPEGTKLNASNSYKFSSEDISSLLAIAGFNAVTYTQNDNPMVLSVGTKK